MIIEKITEKGTAELSTNAHFLVTQEVNGTESLRRVPAASLKDTALRSEVSALKASIGTGYMSAGTSWTQSTGTHSSQQDWIHLECSEGDEITVDIHTESEETGVTGTLVCATNNRATAVTTRSISTGTPLTFTLPGDAEDFSVFLNALSAPSTVYFSVRKSTTVSDQLDDVSDAVAECESQIDALKDVIGSFESAGTSWAQTSGSHSSQNDWVHLECVSGDVITVDVHTESGETGVSGTVVCATNNKSTAVTTKPITTGTPVSFTLPGNAEDFSLYLNPLSSPSMVYFSIRRESKLMNRMDDIAESVEACRNRIDEINSHLALGETSFAMRANVGHSNTVDTISLEVAKGEKFELLVATDNGEKVTGTFVCTKAGGGTDQFGLTTNCIDKFTAANDYTQFGVYIAAMTTAANVTFRIVKQLSPYYKEDITDCDVWESVIAATVSKLAAQQTYVNGLSFVFITDMHWETNWHGAPALINRICDRSRVKLVINGGDVASGDGAPHNGSGANGIWQTEWLYKATSEFNGNYDYFAIKGNHDTNLIGTWAEGADHELTPAQIRQLMLPPSHRVRYPDSVPAGFETDDQDMLALPKYATSVASTSISSVPCYYSFDAYNTTFICLDTGIVGAIDADQIAWAKSVMQNTNMPYILIFMHIIWGGDGANNGAEPCTMYLGLMEAIDELTAAQKAKIQAIFTGHVHVDRNEMSSNGIPIVATDTDSRYANDGITRAKGTTTQQCFDVVTIDYDKQKIYCNRVGTIGLDREISYKPELGGGGTE